MSNKADVIVGIQWGDEGKGRIVDLYAKDYDVVARFGGGDNAGHSIKVGETELALRIVPSGVLQPHVDLFIGGGTVVSLSGLISELENLQKHGIDTSRIKISDRAHVVFPYHAARDKAAEEARGENKIGTTGRGIGPAYADKAARTGITFGNLLCHPEEHSKSASRRTEAEEVILEARLVAERIHSHIVDGVEYIHDALKNKRVLIEGAQGSLLDVGYGTYPYVTSSHTIAGGACIGLGIGPTTIGRVIGVVKAYCTRVGAGPFPSELHDEYGERLRKQGHEFGTVTGRPRRCGWFDAVAAKYAVQLNGLTAAVITKLDVLSGFKTLGIVTAYKITGNVTSNGASEARAVEMQQRSNAIGFNAAADPNLEVVVEEMEGWSEPIEGVRRIADLPKAAQNYVARIQELLGVPVELVSVGPERSQLARP